jgi:hypothetical protein
MDALATTAMAKGAVACFKTDGTLELMESKSKFQNRKMVVILHDVEADKKVFFKSEGEVISDGFDFTGKIGQKVFVRYDADLHAPAMINISTEQLLGKEGNEDLYIEAGEITATNAFEFKPGLIARYL